MSDKVTFSADVDKEVKQKFRVISRIASRSMAGQLTFLTESLYKQTFGDQPVEDVMKKLDIRG